MSISAFLYQLHFARTAWQMMLLTLLLSTVLLSTPLTASAQLADAIKDGDDGDCKKLGLDVCPQNPTPQDIGGYILTFIGYFITFVGLIALAALIWGGVTYIIALGNDQKVENAKRIIFYSIVGMIVVGFSAAVVNLIFGIFTPTP